MKAVSLRLRLLSLVTTAMLCFLSGEVRAGAGDVNIEAEKMLAYPDGTLEAEGGVTVEGQTFSARADRLYYDPGTARIRLVGNVEMSEVKGGLFTGKSLELDLNTLAGAVSGGEFFIEESGIRIIGEVITRLGPDELEVRKGEFTSCPGDCPDWSFTASRLKIRKEGYVTARHAAFRIAGIPVFYSPYLFFPVKTERQSGLLLPELSYTERSGLEVSLPVYITLGDAADLTITPRTFTRDETGLQGEFRYDLPWGGGGEWSGFSIGDREDRGLDRWYASATHAMRTVTGVWTRGRWYDAGNPDAPVDFGDSFQDRNPGAVDRHLFVEGDWDRAGIRVGMASLVPDAGNAGSLAVLDRLEAGAGLGWYKVGSLDVQAGLEYTEFDIGGERLLVNQGLSLGLAGPGPLSGRLWAQWQGSHDGEGTVEDSFSLLALEERISLSKRASWGLHRLEMSLAGVRSTPFTYNESAPRDSRDNGREHALVSGRFRSLVIGPSYSWELLASGWSDSKMDKAMGFGRTLLKKDPWYLEATVNRDAEFGLVLPLQAGVEGRWEGWTAGAGFNSDAAELEVEWESREDKPLILSGSYRYTLKAFEFEGSAQFDLDTDRTSDERHTVTYLADCWELGVSRLRNLSRTDWRLVFRLAN